MSFAIEAVNDLDAAWDDLTALFLEFEAYHQAFEPRPLVPDWEQRLRERLRLHDDRLVLLARAGGEAAGCLTGIVRRDDGLGAGISAYLSYAFVRSQFRDAGIGTAMLGHAEAWCRDRDAQRIELDVFVENALGVRFWSGAGFRPHSTTMIKPLEVPR